MVKLSNSDQATLDAHNSWKEWGAQFGWNLYRTNFRHSATYMIGEQRQFFNVTEQARNDIDRALSAARKS